MQIVRKKRAVQLSGSALYRWRVDIPIDVWDGYEDFHQEIKSIDSVKTISVSRWGDKLSVFYTEAIDLANGRYFLYAEDAYMKVEDIGKVKFPGGRLVGFGKRKGAIILPLPEYAPAQKTIYIKRDVVFVAEEYDFQIEDGPWVFSVHSDDDHFVDVHLHAGYEEFNLSCEFNVPRNEFEQLIPLTRRDDDEDV